MAENKVLTHKFVIGTYLDYLFYNFFRSRFQELMSKRQVVAEGLDKQTWEGVFFAPQDLMRRRSALLKGMPHPLVCFWRQQPLSILKGFYGHSVMNRNFVWKWKGDPVKPEKEWENRASSGRLITYSATYNLFAESYYMEFINQFSNDMVELDIQRYIEFHFNGYLDEYKTRIEFIMQTNKVDSQVDEDKQTRAFTATTEWQVNFMMPEIRDGFFLEQVRLWLAGQPVLRVQAAKQELPAQSEVGS